MEEHSHVDFLVFVKEILVFFQQRGAAALVRTGSSTTAHVV